MHNIEHIDLHNELLNFTQYKIPQGMSLHFLWGFILVLGNYKNPYCESLREGYCLRLGMCIEIYFAFRAFRSETVVNALLLFLFAFGTFTFSLMCSKK